MHLNMTVFSNLKDGFDCKDIYNLTIRPNNEVTPTTKLLEDSYKYNNMSFCRHDELICSHTSHKLSHVKPLLILFSQNLT